MKFAGGSKQINHYPVNKHCQNQQPYPVESDKTDIVLPGPEGRLLYLYEAYLFNKASPSTCSFVKKTLNQGSYK